MEEPVEKQIVKQNFQENNGINIVFNLFLFGLAWNALFSHSARFIRLIYTQALLYSIKIIFSSEKKYFVSVFIFFAGIILAAVRCYILHCVPFSADSPLPTPMPQPASEGSPITRATLDLLVGHENQPDSETSTNKDRDHQQIQHSHHYRHHHPHLPGNHKKKRSS